MEDLKAINRLIDSLTRLPSVGYKSAERMAYALLNMSNEEVDELANSIKNLKTEIHQCPICGLYTQKDKCEICLDNSRDQHTLIVISNAKEVTHFEKINTYHGLYHVLNGNISAIKGIGINDLNVASLLERVKKNDIKEIIIATDATVEGETTALYLAKMFENNKNITISRLAYGLPMGGHIDYADSLTISKALEGRKKI